MYSENDDHFRKRCEYDVHSKAASLYYFIMIFLFQNGAIVKFGRIHCFRFLDPYFEERIRQRQDSLRNIHEYAYDR